MLMMVYGRIVSSYLFQDYDYQYHNAPDYVSIVLIRFV